MSSVNYSDLPWRSTWMIQRTLSPTLDWTNWSGYMQAIFLLADNSSSKDHTNILLFSVICFVNNEIRSRGLTGTPLTFDHPLLVRAVEIVRAKDVSHPDECSRRCIPSYAMIGRGRSAGTSLRSKCSHAYAVGKGLYPERFVLYIYWTQHYILS